jgi:archaellum component FlaC
MSAKDEVVTKGYLDGVMKSHTDEIVGVIQAFMVNVDDRFNKLEAKVDNLQEDMTSVMNRLDSIEKDISLN